MAPVVEVFADITCPFAHVGLKQVAHRLASIEGVSLVVKAWPLEWVNSAGLAADAVLEKSQILTDQLEISDFDGFDVTAWPTSTIGALNLTADAYGVSDDLGLRVALDVRAALFERGENVGDQGVLRSLAENHGLPGPAQTASDLVTAEYRLGLDRQVNGSPHFFFDSEDFFCPALDLGHDTSGALTARFDTNALNRFVAKVANVS